MISSIELTSEKAKFFLWGLAFSILLNKFSSIPKRIYIFFHELSHVIAAIFFSAKIFAFHIGSDEGYIQSNKSNLVIRLAPYLFPILSWIILFIHFAILIYAKYYFNYNGTILFTFFLIGFFFSTTCYFHAKLILQETSDIDREKLMLSFLIIFNAFFLSSSTMLYGLFESEKVLLSIYFLD